jgi:hypothetical protein
MSSSAAGKFYYFRWIFIYLRKLARVDSSKIFILPTWYCVVFNFSILLLLLLSFPLRSVPLLALSVFVIFIQLLSMVESHVNLRELEIAPIRDLLVEASSQSVLTLQVASRDQSLGLNFRLLDESEYIRDKDGEIPARHMRKFIFRELKVAFWQSLKERETEQFSFVKVERESQTLQLPFPAGQRGIHSLPPVLVFSLFPFGLFRTVKIIELKESYYAYPAPLTARATGRYKADEIAAEVLNASTSRLVLGTEEYAHHRPFRFGDALRRVDWRASSRRGATIVRVFETTMSDRAHVLRWQDTVSKDSEGKLSELAFGVLEAARAGDEYALEMPYLKTKVAHGERHKIDCLRILASHGTSNNPAGVSLP